MSLQVTTPARLAANIESHFGEYIPFLSVYPDEFEGGHAKLYHSTHFFAEWTELVEFLIAWRRVIAP